MILKTSFKETVSLFLTNLIFVSFLPFLHLSVHALDVPSTGSATGDWAVSQAISAGTSAVETAILTQYSSLDPTTLAILEAELGFSYALGQDVWAMQNGIDDFTIGGTTFSALSGVCYIPVDGVNELCVCSATFSPSGLIMRSSYGVYACIRGSTGTSPWLSWTGSTCVFHLTGSSSNRFLMYSGSFFDNPTPYTTPYFTNMASNFTWISSGNPPVITRNTWVYNNSSYYANCTNFLRTDIAPISVDTSSDDVPTIMAAYKSALASQLGVTVEDVDEVWTLPDQIPEEPTEPDGSGCCCQPFELPSEWVQSDVVELETDHYTIPYTDLVREPYNYLIYGATNMPPPVTPADDAKKALQTKTTTTQANRSGDPVQDLRNMDPEMYEALFDYSVFIQDIFDQSGVLPYWAILMAAGALFLII